jgi:hypothetical protein
MIILKEKKTLNEGRGSSAGYKLWNEIFVKMLSAAGWISNGACADLDFLRDEFVEFL